MNEKSDDELLLMIQLGPWSDASGFAGNTLYDALLRASEISGSGKSPYPLNGPDGIAIGHGQMLRLWRRLKMAPARKPL